MGLFFPSSKKPVTPSLESNPGSYRHSDDTTPNRITDREMEAVEREMIHTVGREAAGKAMATLSGYRDRDIHGNHGIDRGELKTAMKEMRTNNNDGVSREDAAKIEDILDDRVKL